MNQIVVEHNHGKLWMGFGISFFMFGVGLFLAIISNDSTTLEGKGFSLGVGVLVIVASILMLRGVFQKRNDCPICKDKYLYGRKKNA